MQKLQGDEIQGGGENWFKGDKALVLAPLLIFEGRRGAGGQASFKGVANVLLPCPISPPTKILLSTTKRQGLNPMFPLSCRSRNITSTIVLSVLRLIENMKLCNEFLPSFQRVITEMQQVQVSVHVCTCMQGQTN